MLTRTIQYVGTLDWIEQVLAKCAVRPGKPINAGDNMSVYCINESMQQAAQILQGETE